MTTTELLALFREEVVDQETPYLWSDALVYGYIDAAQKQFCRDTYGIADARKFKLNILADGTEWYKTDVRILKIRAATNSATGAPVSLIPEEKLESEGIRFDGQVGEARVLITGLEKNMVRAYPKPNQAATIDLRVFRLSTDVAAGDDLEIDSQHIPALLFWVKHKAYAVTDSEVFDKGASDRYLDLWSRYCAAALVEQSRAMHTAGVVQYGGI